jgi:hypothetical protein
MAYLVRSEVLSRLTPQAMEGLHRLARTEAADATEAELLALGITLDVLPTVLAREGATVAEALNEALASRGLRWRLVALS